MILNTLATQMKEKGIAANTGEVRNELASQIQAGKIQLSFDQIDAISDAVAKIMGGTATNTVVTPDTPEPLVPISHPTSTSRDEASATSLPPGNWPFPLSAIFDNDDDRDFSYDRLMIGNKDLIASLPPMIDHTPTMSPVKNQGRLGSCVGFAVSAMKEWQENQEYKKEVKEGSAYRREKEHYDLSEQWIYYSCKKIDPWPNIEGTSIRYAMKVLNKIGVPTEDAWPYNDTVIGEPKRWSHLIARWGTIGSYYRIASLNAMKDALAKQGPVVIGMLCFAGIFGVGRDGVVPNPSSTERILGGHAVCAVGYDDDRKLVKFKNSWGTGWGRKGYGYISYDYVNKYVIDSWVAMDHDVTTEMLKGAVSLI